MFFKDLKSLKFFKGLYKLRYILLVIFLPFILFIIFDLLFPFSIEESERDYSRLFLDRTGRILHIGLSPTHKYRLKVSLSDMPDYLVRGFIEYEDKYFYFHPGFNPVSIVKAFYFNLISGKIVSGGSTITMQLVRLIKKRNRTYISKLLEIFNAMQLEFHYSKKKLLEIYLNKVPMGGNIEGVGAASWFYFGKSVKDISLREALVLIAIPNNPNKNKPDIEGSLCKRSYEKVVNKISKRNYFKNKVFDFPEYVLKKKYKNPYFCPHLIESKAKGVTEYNLYFSVDLNIQNFCENVLSRYIKKYKNKGINNCALIVVDNKTMEVLAYVGSQDYFDDKNEGKINGANILRSPGSTLKPFIYAKAMDLGLITPKKIVYDIPKYYKDKFIPYNFEKTTEGLVTAEYALLKSLNIPAIRLEEEMGEDGLYEILEKLYPFSREKDLRKAGLTKAIGGFYVTLEDLVSLYASLANGGNFRRLTFFVSTNQTKGEKILSEETCYITSEILSEYYRPDLPHCWEFAPNLARLALKTGTSFGLKDAWCVGYNPDYTIGVWFGNFNGRGSPFLIGAEIASPVLVEVFNFLTRKSDRWFTRPSKVNSRKVCSVSGERPGPFCSNLIDDYYIEGKSSEKECSVHKQVFVSKKDNFIVCSHCIGTDENEYKKVIIEDWPLEVAYYLKTSGKRYLKSFKHNPDCEHFAKHNAPRIVSPEKSSVFYSLNQNETEKIVFSAMCDSDVEYLYWFMNNEFVTKSKIDEKVVILPEKGKHKITVFDDSGRSDSILIEVR